ncbi:alpha/beta hydrolase [Lacinutrix algicola]|uniref:alpha/beta hydrolase n=1 Tax=Lacinutrix algicola TaxID=342954 RepID=UPI0006E14962|nr:alpha/beta hydrolase-fold protein [Lacinutrix algicola]
MKYFILVFVVILSVSCNRKKSESTNKSIYYTDTINSVYLKELRLHNIYLPKNFDKNKNYKIVFATDGSKIYENSFRKKMLDSLIDNNIIPPILYVESFYNKKIADSTSMTTGDGEKVKLNYRNFEYVEDQYNEGADIKLKDRFNNHMLYFEEEFIPIVEKELGLKNNENSRIFYGFSNGAGFGVSLLNRHPNLIGTYICFSTMGFNSSDEKWNKNVEYPNLYLKYGEEESFLDYIHENIKENYKVSSSFVDIEVYDGGHDGKIWEKKFRETLIQVLKN